MSDGSCVIPKTYHHNRGVRLAYLVKRIRLVDDFVAIVASYFTVYFFRLPETLGGLLKGRLQFTSAYAQVYFDHAPVYLALTFAFLFACYAVLGMYEGHRRIRRTPILWNALVGNGLVIGVVAVYLFFTKSTWHMRGFIPLVLIVNIFMTVLFRRVTSFILKKARNRHPSLRVKALLIGFTDDAEILNKWSMDGCLKGCSIVSHIASPATMMDVRRILPSLLVPDIGVVFVIDRDMKTDVIMDIVRICAKHNKTVNVLFPRFLTLHNPFAYGDMIDGIPIVHFSSPEFSNTDVWYRRLGSMTAATLLLILLFPLHLLVILLIKLDSCGPAVFVQNRVGVNGSVFRMLKYRTMCKDAEHKLHDLRCQNETDGALFKMRHDPRVTCFGRLLRKSSIDELPQLVNIMRGEMRFVGPRPLPVTDLQGYEHTWNFMRQICPPGITCIWQVAGRSRVGFEEMCLLDIWYALNRNWILDLCIVFRTAWVVAFGRGAY